MFRLVHLIAIACVVLFASVEAFAPMPRTVGRPTTHQFINIGEREREGLTRDSEPEEFFATYVVGH